MRDKETRYLPTKVELRERDGEGDKLPAIEGRAVVYGAWSHDLGGFRERFEPGAFGDLDGADVLASLNHDMRAQLLGRTPDTLTLRDGKDGLDYRITPPDTGAARDAVELIRSGIVPGSSFTFRVKAGGEKIAEDKDGNVTRTVTDAELFEVAPVASPAYPQTDTSVAQRSIEAFKKSKTNAEEQRFKAADAELELHRRWIGV